MAYDRKFREKVIDFIVNGNSIQKAHEVFGVGTTTIKEWKKLQAETGSLENRELNRQASKLRSDLLEAYVTEKPDSYQDEIAKEFNCTQSAVSYALKRLKLRRKKNP